MFLKWSFYQVLLKNLFKCLTDSDRPLCCHVWETDRWGSRAVFVSNKKVIHLSDMLKVQRAFRALTASCWRCLWCPLVWPRRAAWLAHRHTSRSMSSGPAPRGSEPPRGSAGWPGWPGWLGWCCRGWAEPDQGGRQGERPTLTMRREEKRTDVDSHVDYMDRVEYSWGGNVGMQVK